jgi:hypothetical protein
VAPQRRLDWRQIPHQVDEINPAGGPEISFLADVPENEVATYYLYFAPTRAETAEFPQKTSAAEDWVPPNIGWESNRCAYRAYWGQFDFFGKKTEQLIYPTIGATSYHSEVEWGIDALHVGEASGLGGLTVYEGPRAWPVQNPAGKGEVDFGKRILVQGPVRCAVEITAGNIVPQRADLKVHMLCVIYAERQETEIVARVSGADGDVVLAPGVVKLPREEAFVDAAAGYVGAWGWQQDVIGEIAMGLIVPPKQVVDWKDEPAERRIRCRASQGELRYWAIGDWRRGRQHPVGPTVGNWRRELADLAGLLLDDVEVKMGQPEDAS